MEKTRLQLHERLISVLRKSGVKDPDKHCYFEPPSQMKYPCIRYEAEMQSVDYADNTRYRVAPMWRITIIDQNPDSTIPNNLLEEFPTYCTKDREYSSDYLRHFIYTLYY